MEKKQVTFAVNIKLTEKDATKITSTVPGEMVPADKVAGVAAGLLEDLARGGVMLAPETVSKVVTAMGPFDADTLVDKVESGSKRRGGRREVVWEVDPSYEAAIEQTARVQNRSTEGVVRSIMDHAKDEEWFTLVGPQPLRVLMNEKDLAEVGEIIGVKEPTGTDIANWIKDQATLPIEPEMDNRRVD